MARTIRGGKGMLGSVDPLSLAGWVFICPHCGHDQGYFIGGRHIYPCTACTRQVSVMAGTIFEAS
ncbi:transposase [Candidatus Nitrotoga sp. 1052]|uniref:transposase n=1 Tax=Candidatus Nitrotoga sp. 1052 TaxID=2886964 RepID=UPI00403DF963